MALLIKSELLIPDLLYGNSSCVYSVSSALHLYLDICQVSRELFKYVKGHQAQTVNLLSHTRKWFCETL